MSRPLRIVGNYISPYVRKVLVALDLKGVAYEIDPLVPFFGDDRFTAISPLRRIPVLIDDEVTLTDSTVICEYLEDRYPTPALLPADPVARARARWLEEFADTRMGDVFIWRLFNNVVVRPVVWGEEGDAALIERTLREDVPQVLDYLEAQAPAEGFLFGQVTIADIAIAAFFRNAAFARFRVDAGRWPRTAAYVERVLALPSFTKLRPFEEVSRRTALAEHRKALADAGAPIAADTFAGDRPRRGVMRV